MSAQSPSNPFCSRFVRPGATPFLFPPGESAETLVARLAERHWRGEIVGPHGSGKSALLAELIRALEAAGRRVVHAELHDGQSRLPEAVTSGAIPAWAVLAVDGCEQLSWWQFRVLLRVARRARAGLVITAHRSLGLPELYRTHPTAELAVRVVAGLQGASGSVTEAEVRQAFATHNGDLREMLFRLYDLYQLRQHARET